jgi:hypothetical protein
LTVTAIMLVMARALRQDKRAQRLAHHCHIRPAHALGGAVPNSYPVHRAVRGYERTIRHADSIAVCCPP